MEDWADVAKRNGISYKLFLQRINQNGWSLEKAATEPVRKRNDNKWRKTARENGISNRDYYRRVDEMFWSPEEAATTPIMSREERSRIANNAKAEYKEITDERIFNDENNMFKLAPQHLKIAEQNGLLKNTVCSRIIKYGWTVQEAISTPIKEPSFSRPEGYFEYRDIAKRNNISVHTYRERVKRGWSLEDASTKGPALSNPTRADREWIELAAKNGIRRNTYDSRIRTGWSPEQAATTPVLQRGEYLNEQTREKAAEGFKKFREGAGA